MCFARLPHRLPAKATPVTRLLTLAAVALPSLLDGQAPPSESRLRAGMGIVRHVQADALASPLRYRGWGPAANLDWERVRQRHRMSAHVAYSGTSLESGISAPPTSTEQTHRLTVSLAYLRGLRDERSLALLVGGRLAGDALYRNHIYHAGTEHFGDLFVMLEAAAAVEWRPRADLRVEERLSVPVAGVVWRPYTGMKYWPEARFALPDQLQGLRHELVVTRALGRRAALLIAHELVLLRHPEPWELARAHSGSGSGSS
jgi:hypothetical protein